MIYFKNNRKGFLVAVLIIVIAVALYFLTFPSENKVDNSTNALINDISFGIKYPFSQSVIENLSSARNFEDLETFKEDFLRTYNEYAITKSKDSQAFLSEDLIRLSISQPTTWNSTWYVDLKIDLKKVNQHNYRCKASFDFIYGPTDDIYLERFQGGLAKEAIIQLIKGTLISMNEVENITEDLSKNNVTD